MEVYIREEVKSEDMWWPREDKREIEKILFRSGLRVILWLSQFQIDNNKILKCREINNYH